MNIHPLAVIHPSAKLGRDVVIGPFCVIEADVTIGNHCVLDSHVVIKQQVTIGDHNHIHEGAVIGGMPQHVRLPERPGGLSIGSGNTIREHATIHRAMQAGHLTVVGNNSLLMSQIHIAHDCQVGNHTVFANGATLAGHVTVEDRAYVSGYVGVHQFCRIGRMAMVGGQAHVVKDIPPFVTIDGASGYVVGLNTIGLRRSGATTEEINELKAAYRVIYRSGLKWSEVLDRLARDFREGIASHFYHFLVNTHRGVTQERRMPPGATIKLRDVAPESYDMPDVRARAG